MSELFLTFLLGILGGVIGSLAHKWGLERKVSQLEFDLYSLVERVNTEVKRRASAAGKRAKEFEEDALALGKTAAAAPTPSNSNWWWNLANQGKG